MKDKPQRSWFAHAWIGLLVLLTKAKTLVIALMKMKGLATVVTAVISMFAYWWTLNLGWPGAVGFVGLMYVHEMGHYWAMRYYRLPSTGPRFVPFLGAYVAMKKLPLNIGHNAIIALAGPLVGSLGALACLGVYALTHAQLWLWLCWTGVFLNLTNLIPVSPLDGGRIVDAIWRGFWIVGLVVLFALTIYLQSGLLFLLTVLGMVEVDRKYMNISLPIWILVLGISVGFEIHQFGLLKTLSMFGLLIGCTVAALVLVVVAYVAFKEITAYCRTKVAEEKETQVEAAVEPVAAGEVSAQADAVGEVTPASESETDSDPEMNAPAEDSEAEDEPEADQATLKEVIQKQYYEIPSWKRVAIGIAYLGLTAVLAWSFIVIQSSGVFPASTPFSLF